MRNDRLIIGLICIAIAVWMFISGEVGDNPAPAIAVTIIGITLVAISRRRK